MGIGKLFRDKESLKVSSNNYLVMKVLGIEHIGIAVKSLESTDPEGPIGLFIENKGQGIHHIAFEVDDVDKALTESKLNGIRLIDQKGRKGAEGLSIGFLNPKSTFGTLTELCSSNSKTKG